MLVAASLAGLLLHMNGPVHSRVPDCGIAMENVRQAAGHGFWLAKPARRSCQRLIQLNGRRWIEEQATAVKELQITRNALQDIERIISTMVSSNCISPYSFSRASADGSMRFWSMHCYVHTLLIPFSFATAF